MIPYFNFDKYMPGIGAVKIHVFGILVATGILVGAWLTQKRGKELGLVKEQVAEMITTTLVCGFIFAHIFDVFAYQTKGPDPSLWDILNPFGGLSSYGGFIGAVAGMVGWAKYRKQPIMPYADGLGYGLAAGWMFGRLGCFTAHDHPGLHTNFFLGVNYPDGVRHDLGLYEAIWAGGMALLFYFLSRKKRPLGIYVTLLVSCYAPIRFALDFLRAGDVSGADPRYAGLTPAQWLTVVTAVVGALLAVWTIKHARSEGEAPEPTASKGKRRDRKSAKA
jgi:phosphatidylglycerol:prolipoprotein diacylglycerol transferase